MRRSPGENLRIVGKVFGRRKTPLTSIEVVEKTGLDIQTVCRTLKQMVDIGTLTRTETRPFAYTPTRLPA